MECLLDMLQRIYEVSGRFIDVIIVFVIDTGGFFRVKVPIFINGSIECEMLVIVVKCQF